MWGKKQQIINNLREEIVCKDDLIRTYSKMTEEQRNKIQEAGSAYDRAEARSNKMSEEVDQALESCRNYETQIIEATDDLARERSINQALADENRDLVRQLELLRAVLGQLSIQVKLPGRKK